jgi:hypothetical protein
MDSGVTLASGAAGSLTRTRTERGCCFAGVARENAPHTGMRTEDIIAAAIASSWMFGKWRASSVRKSAMATCVDRAPR